MTRANIILSVLLILTLISCGPTQKLKRAERLLAKAGELGAKWHSDTVYQDVTVLVPSVTHDTTFTSLPGDTVTLTKDRLQVKYVRLPGDSVFIEGTCLPDTVRISVPVEVTRTIEAGYTVWDILKWCLFTGVVVFLAIQALKFFRP